MNEPAEAYLGEGIRNIIGAGVDHISEFSDRSMSQVYFAGESLVWANRKRKEKNMAGAYETKPAAAMYLRSMVIPRRNRKKSTGDIFETNFHGSEEEARFYHEAGKGYRY